MEQLFDLLRQFIPAWAALITIAVVYLIYQYKKVYEEYLSIAEKQTGYLKERVETVDKVTDIFDKTINRQQNEIEKLTAQVKYLEKDLNENQSVSTTQAISELGLLSEAVQQLINSQEYLSKMMEQQRLPAATGNLLTEGHREIATNLESEISQAIRTRELSLYTIKVIDLKGTNALIEDLKARGYVVKIYQGFDSSEDAKEYKEERQEAIWIGKDIPPAFAIEIMSVARHHWPFLKYIYITDEVRGQPWKNRQVFLGGSSQTATDIFHLSPWDSNAFNEFRRGMSLEEFHHYIRSHYKVSLK